MSFNECQEVARVPCGMLVLIILYGNVNAFLMSLLNFQYVISTGFLKYLTRPNKFQQVL